MARRTPRRGKRAGDWAAWSDGVHTVTLALRGFWQNYPKDLALSTEGLELVLCPFLKPDEYARAQGTVDEHRLYYYLQNGVYKLRKGVSKTHDLWLDFARGQAAVSPLRSRTVQLMAAAPAEWYTKSNARGELAPHAASGILAQSTILPADL